MNREKVIENLKNYYFNQQINIDFFYDYYKFKNINIEKDIFYDHFLLFFKLTKNQLINQLEYEYNIVLLMNNNKIINIL